jgi:CRISPR type I-E-associated protein CasB/Cse2
MSATEQYVKVLTSLKVGDLGLLRTHAGQGLDESVDGFDLFAGLWWPLRQQKGGPPPRREVSWLIAKLYAFSPIEHSPGDTLASQLRLWRTEQDERLQQRFDRMLILPLNRIEPALQWALGCIGSNNRKLDWVELAKDLSRWDRQSTRLRWAKQFLGDKERGESC